MAANLGAGLDGNCLSFPGSVTLLPKAPGTCLFVWRSEDFEGGHSPPPPWVPGKTQVVRPVWQAISAHDCVLLMETGMESGVSHPLCRVSEP